jgi:hypothetical protein
VPREVDFDQKDSEVNNINKLINKQKGAERIIYGLDVGRVKDYSTLAIIVRHIMPNMDANYTLVSRYYCVYLHRYDLMTPYETIENDAARWWKWGENVGLNKAFVMDMTGVGAPVWEGIKRKGVRVQGVNITAGALETNPAPNIWDVPKAALVTQLVRTAQTGRFKGYDTLDGWKELQEELGSFGYKINTESNTVTYESLHEKVHDDLVMAVALAVWYGERVIPWRQTLARGAELGDLDYNPLRPSE